MAAVQGDCHWNLKNSGNSHWVHELIMQFSCRQSQSIFRLTNYKSVMPSNKVLEAMSHCSGSLEPEFSCHDRDWIMELPMEADILTFTGILTPEGASVASCFPFDITISLSWFPLPCLHLTPLSHRGRETSSGFWAVTLVTLKIQMYTDGYRICILKVTIGGYRITARYWPHGLTSLDRPCGLAGVHRSGHDLFPRINKKRLNMRRILIRTW